MRVGGAPSSHVKMSAAVTWNMPCARVTSLRAATTKLTRLGSTSADSRSFLFIVPASDEPLALRAHFDSPTTMGSLLLPERTTPSSWHGSSLGPACSLHHSPTST